jgi:hypothetical protein
MSTFTWIFGKLVSFVARKKYLQVSNPKKFYNIDSTGASVMKLNTAVIC